MRSLFICHQGHLMPTLVTSKVSGWDIQLFVWQVFFAFHSTLSFSLSFSLSSSPTSSPFTGKQMYTFTRLHTWHYRLICTSCRDTFKHTVIDNCHLVIESMVPLSLVSRFTCSTVNCVNEKEKRERDPREEKAISTKIRYRINYFTLKFVHIWQVNIFYSSTTVSFKHQSAQSIIFSRQQCLLSHRSYQLDAEHEEREGDWEGEEETRVTLHRANNSTVKFDENNYTLSAYRGKCHIKCNWNTWLHFTHTDTHANSHTDVYFSLLVNCCSLVLCLLCAFIAPLWWSLTFLKIELSSLSLCFADALLTGHPHLSLAYNCFLITSPLR